MHTATIVRRERASAAPRPAGSPMALTRVLQLLRLLADAPAGLALAPLCVAMNAPKTSVLSLLRGLTAQGYLQRSDTVYRLGPESFALGSALVAACPLDVVALPYLHEAVARCGETALIARIDRAAGELVYGLIVESARPIRYAVTAGTTRPLFISAAGRALLAFQDEAWRRGYLRHASLRAMTEHSITDRTQLTRLIDEIRAKGVAVTFGEVTPDVAGFAAPIFEPDGSVNAALLIATPLERGRATADALQGLVLELAQNISHALGHPTGGPPTARPASITHPAARGIQPKLTRRQIHEQ